MRDIYLVIGLGNDVSTFKYYIYEYNDSKISNTNSTFE